MWIDAGSLDEPDQAPPPPQQYAMTRESRAQEPMAVSSSKAIVLAARRLNHVLQTHGPQAIALWVSSRTAREARHLAARFARKALRSARFFTDGGEARSAVDRGEVRALWLFGCDCAADACRCRRTLAGVDCVILQDQQYPVGEVAASDVFFPVQRSEDDDSAEARPAWWWVQQVALAMGFRAGFAFASEEQIRAEIAREAGV
jgi:predicted molibdopterin-dependent oxidoreductase YjgC